MKTRTASDEQPYTKNNKALTSFSPSLQVLHLTASIAWKTGRPPIDEPPCGYRDQKCQFQTGEIVAGVTGGVVLLLLVVSLIAYRNWRYEQELDSLLWKIEYKEIKMNEWSSNHAIVPNKMSRGLYSTVRTSQLSLSSNPTSTSGTPASTPNWMYRGRVVRLKQVSSKGGSTSRGRLKKELKTMRDLRHDNLLGFIGACVDPPHVCIVTEYCSRGSLKDLLENEDVKLDNMFIASLVGDIVQGMVYLHDSPVKSHGNLKTSNCLVDSRWVVKITDFGIHELKAGTETAAALSDASETQRKCTDLLYRAPELLRDTAAPPGGTQKGDVYSFAIVLYEVHGRHGPWGNTDQSPVVLLRQVMSGPLNGNPPFSDTQKGLVALANPLPDLRPERRSSCAAEDDSTGDGHPFEPQSGSPWSKAPPVDSSPFILITPGERSNEGARRCVARASKAFAKALEAAGNQRRRKRSAAPEPPGGVLDCVRTVLNECWAEIPEERPDFRSIRTKLRPLRKGM
ncbi:hypothetical protein C7M84_009635 [Penaeus vannamei]|uniref:guanylate cyclase n=1 Tax=Penaeus vannamei TaxID=6689 RepID=A0A3R7M4Y0_PENVA|nr:hypothetical protein C7M84_009635 [Penaeus vannamei]